MKTKEQVMELWKDQEKCPDFTPVLEEVLEEREVLKECLKAALKLMKTSPKVFREVYGRPETKEPK